MSCYIQHFTVKRTSLRLGVKVFGIDVDDSPKGYSPSIAAMFYFEFRVYVTHINEFAQAIVRSRNLHL
jgi:hypothetical protein